MDKENMNEEATQVGNVDAGKISVFGNDAGNKFKENNWYDQLFELNDFNNIPLEFKVEDYTVENTGGGTMVAMGTLKDGNYFGLSSESLAIFDADYHEAYFELEDITEWEEEHRINYFDYYDEEYNIVASQVKGFEVEDEE